MLHPIFWDAGDQTRRGSLFSSLALGDGKIRDPGNEVESETGISNGRGTGSVSVETQGLARSLAGFLLRPAPTNCPWVSEDGSN